MQFILYSTVRIQKKKKECDMTYQSRLISSLHLLIPTLIFLPPFFIMITICLPSQLA